jgi:hypothetical protein
MSRYTKSINLQQDGTGFALTITETVGDESPIVTELSFADATELKAYTDAQLDKAIAEQTLFETQANRAEGEQRAWFAALNSVSENDYYSRKRPKIKEWTDGYNFRYLNSAGQAPVDCTINASGFVRPIEGAGNFLRVTFDSRRRIEARVPGAPDTFLMLSADEQWWVGTDADNVMHRLRRIQKTGR